MAFEEKINEKPLEMSLDQKLAEEAIRLQERQKVIWAELGASRGGSLEEMDKRQAGEEELGKIKERLAQIKEAASLIDVGAPVEGAGPDHKKIDLDLTEEMKSAEVDPQKTETAAPKGQLAEGGTVEAPIQAPTKPSSTEKIVIDTATPTPSQKEFEELKEKGIRLDKLKKHKTTLIANIQKTLSGLGNLSVNEKDLDYKFSLLKQLRGGLKKIEGEMSLLLENKIVSRSEEVLNENKKREDFQEILSNQPSAYEDQVAFHVSVEEVPNVTKETYGKRGLLGSSLGGNDGSKDWDGEKNKTIAELDDSKTGRKSKGLVQKLKESTGLEPKEMETLYQFTVRALTEVKLKNSKPKSS